jgi:tripeptide aminopeptidase
VIIKAPAQDSLNIKITGLAAHAGLNPEDGINAIKIAGEAIANIKVGRIDKETTANIGLIKGGSATNIIPDEVLIKAEARSHDEDKLQLQVRHMVQEFKKAAEKAGGGVKVEIKRSYNKVSVSRTAEIVNIAGLAAKQMGLKHVISASGGGSDASVIYSFGIPTIGLCIGMEQVHSKKEYISLKNLTLLSDYLVELVKTANTYEQSLSK